MTTLATPCPCPPHPTPEEERQITREVLLLLCELDPPTVRDGRVVIPEGVSEELRARIEEVEGEILWSLGKESGPRWGCSWVPARPPTPPSWIKRRA
jgi:hypothetical protein